MLSLNHKKIYFFLIPLVAFLLLFYSVKLQGEDVQKLRRPLLGNDLPVIKEDTGSQGLKKKPVMLPGSDGKLLIGSRRGNPNRGKMVFEKYCFYCHGKRGLGDGFTVIGLKISPPSFIKDGSILEKSDQEIFDTVTYGVSNFELDMPAWGPILTVEDRLNVIAYIKKMASKLRKEMKVKSGS